MSKPNPLLEQCTESLSHTKITVKANGRVATFLNPGRMPIKKVDLDCWLRTTTSAKADYVISKPGNVDIIVEIKGKDIDHAIEQILATLALWKAVPPYSAKFGGLIVFSRSPERSATLGDVKKRLLEKHKIWLEMGKSGLKEYSFETFAIARR
jgi:hypothetical protein